MGLFFRRRMPHEPRTQMSRRGMFERHTIAAGPDGARNYLLICPQTRSAVLIDARGEPDQVLRAIQAHRAHVRLIILTHGHPECWPALGALRDALGASVGIHLDDADLLPLTPNFALTQNQRLTFDAAQLMVLHTPGHTPGSVCFYGDGNLFTGETLAAGVLGDTSPPLGNQELLIASLRAQLFTLPNDTAIFPAYGKDTTIGAERATFDEWQAGQH